MVFLIVCDLETSKAGRQPKPGLQRPKQYKTAFWRIQIETAWRVAVDNGRRLEKRTKNMLVLTNNSEYQWIVLKFNLNYWYYSIYIYIYIYVCVCVCVCQRKFRAFVPLFDGLLAKIQHISSQSHAAGHQNTMFLVFLRPQTNTVVDPKLQVACFSCIPPH